MQTKIDLKKLRLRPYKKCDAKFIVKWSKDEVAFRNWCSDRWQTYPITAEDMNRKYCDNNLAAYHCYKSVGFKEIENENKEENCFCGEIWSVS